MTKKLKQIVISKDKAVFWLNKNGRWCNRHGEFEHKKIIDYFNASIRRDKGGYYVAQTTDDYQEKVYFNYEDTVLFVVDVLKGKDILLVLNTGKKIKLKPKKLSMQSDNLYMHIGEERIKFTEKSLLKVAALIECYKDQYVIKVKNRKYTIAKAILYEAALP